MEARIEPKVLKYKHDEPMKTITEVKAIVDADLYLVRAGQVTGEVVHVDGGTHRWPLVVASVEGVVLPLIHVRRIRKSPSSRC